MNRLWLASLVCLCGSVALGQPIKRDDLKPGLIFTSTDPGPQSTSLTRLDPTVAITLAEKQAPHPQSAGGDTFRWLGTINIITPGKYQFEAIVAGELAVRIGDKDVLAVKNPAAEGKLMPGAEVDLAPGIQIFEATLKRTGPTVRAELLWRGPGFRSEPIPYFFFGHLPRQRPASFVEDTAREHGRLLVEELSCIRCHKPEATDKIAQGLVERTGPNLGEIGKRAYPGWLDAWLADPQKLRPQTMMPKMFAETETGAAERYATVAYLISLGGPLPQYKPPTVLPNPERQSADRGAKLYITAGCAACHGDQLTQPPTKKKLDDEEIEKPQLKPEDWLHSRGSDSPQSYYLLGAIGSKTRQEPLAKFLGDPLATNPHGRMPNMLLNPQEAQDIARFMIRVTDDKINPAMPAEPKLKASALAEQVLKADEAKALAQLKPAEQWVALGKSLFNSKGCVSCHQVGTAPTAAHAKAPGLAALSRQVGEGCLNRTPDVAKVPVYPLTAVQRNAIDTFLKFGLTGPGSEAPTHAARASFKRFNCLNCHNRDGEGGIDPLLSDKMKSLENAQNADDVQPPRITGVGHKMRSSWMKDVLVNAGRARPWMTLRMPQYGKPNVEFLAEALPQLEGTVTDDAIGKAEFAAEKLETGRALAGKSGFGCITCHDISGIIGGGTRGPDLATTNKRVRFDWYTRWMHQPQRLAPGTKMPQAFIDGKSQLEQYYAGNADKQIEALWAYFSLGPGLPLPTGLEPPKGVIVSAKDRPEIMRTFIPDNAGTKGIAVAYPSGVNMVFDSSRGRLAYAWSGNFLDMTPAWVNRGGNQAKVLGNKFWASPAGQPWAMTSGKELPDFTKTLDDPAYGAPTAPDKSYLGPLAVKFDGYSLDTVGTPTFRYRITPEPGKETLKIRETPEPAKVTVAYGITRKFVVEAPAGKTVWFNAGDTKKDLRELKPEGSKPLVLSADQTELAATSTKLILPLDGERLQVVQVAGAPAGAAWVLAKQSSGGWQLLLRLPASSAPATQEVILNTWIFPKDDEKLLQTLK
jgi:cbb3-type cytochrome oxidase cytochrome c subunit